MRLESDFAAYVAARWPVLVRLLVLLGGYPDEAEEAVLADLARDYVDWARISGSDDPDVYVFRGVLDAWHRRGGRWWDAAPGGSERERVPELAALERELDRLTGAERLALVLRFTTGLSEAQVAGVLDAPPAAVAELVDRALARVDLAAVQGVSR